MWAHLSDDWAYCVDKQGNVGVLVELYSSTERRDSDMARVQCRSSNCIIQWVNGMAWLPLSAAASLLKHKVTHTHSHIALLYTHSLATYTMTHNRPHVPVKSTHVGFVRLLTCPNASPNASIPGGCRGSAGTNQATVRPRCCRTTSPRMCANSVFAPAYTSTPGPCEANCEQAQRCKRK